MDSCCSLLTKNISKPEIDVLTFNSIIENLENLKDLAAKDMTRSELTQARVSILSKVLQKCSDCIDNGHLKDRSVTCLTELYRALRNACVHCQQNQTDIKMDKDLLPLSKQLLETLLSSKQDQNQILTLRCMVQFLGNLCTSNEENQVFVWEMFSDRISDLFLVDDTKLSSYTCMVIHTCLSGNTSNKTLWLHLSTPLILSRLIGFCVEEDCEWGMYVVDSMCQVDNLFAIVFPLLKDRERLFVMEILLDQIHKSEQDYKPSVSNMKYLAEEVKSQAYTILSLLEKEQQQDPVIIVKEIEILGIITSHHNTFDEVNKDKDLLTTVISLLDAIHRIGKEGKNYFSRVDKITKNGEIDQDHAGYCLKRDLVKLIGNMAYKNKHNQNLIREMNGIPLILDQTSIDGRNPYIQQWAIFAIHNICEDNNDNKAVLADLKFSGLADEAETLRKYGIKAEVKDNRIVVKPPEEEEK